MEKNYFVVYNKENEIKTVWVIANSKNEVLNKKYFKTAKIVLVIDEKELNNKFSGSISKALKSVNLRFA